MARKRKPKETTDSTIESVESAAETTATATAEEPPFEPTGTYTPAEDEPVDGKSNGRGRYRSWTSDPSRRFTKLTDTEQQRIVLLFDDKPAEDVRTAMKGAGFQYHPDYDGHKHAWTRYNDYEGRLEVEALEKLIRATAVESPAR